MLNVQSVILASAEHGEPAVHPFVVGALVLCLFLAMLFAVVAFGGGREHS